MVEFNSETGRAAAQKIRNRHRYTPEEARAAGRKGGIAAAAKGREYMAAIGRKGGAARAAKKQEEAERAKLARLATSDVLEAAE